MGVRARLASALGDAAAVVFAWAVMLLAENVAIGFLWRDQFSASWELALARRTVLPVALAGLAPAALLFVAVWEQAIRAANGAKAARYSLGLLGALSSAALGLGVSGGRHFASWAVRGPFVALAAACGAALGAWVLAALARLERRPAALAACGLAMAAFGMARPTHTCCRVSTPRFTLALLVASLLGGALLGVARPGGFGVTVSAVFDEARSFRGRGRGGVRGLDASRRRARSIRAANLRIALVEHAPLAGRAVAALVALRPPASEKAPEGPAVAAAGEIPRSLDWSGHDIVLVSVDALRADHVCGLRIPSRDDPEHRRPRARGHGLRERVLPDPAHVVLDHVDDDGQVPAAAARAGRGVGLGDLGAVPASLRVAHGGVLPAGGLLHRRGPVRALRARAPGVRVRQGGVRAPCAKARAGRGLPGRRPGRPPAVPVGAFLRAARALRRSPRPRLRGRAFARRRRIRRRGRDGRRGHRARGAVWCARGVRARWSSSRRITARSSASTAGATTGRRSTRSRSGCRSSSSGRASARGRARPRSSRRSTCFRRRSPRSAFHGLPGCEGETSGLLSRAEATRATRAWRSSRPTTLRCWLPARRASSASGGRPRARSTGRAPIRSSARTRRRRTGRRSTGCEGSCARPSGTTGTSRGRGPRRGRRL